MNQDEKRSSVVRATMGLSLLGGITWAAVFATEPYLDAAETREKANAAWFQNRTDIDAQQNQRDQARHELQQEELQLRIDKLRE